MNQTKWKVRFDSHPIMPTELITSINFGIKIGIITLIIITIGSLVQFSLNKSENQHKIKQK